MEQGNNRLGRAVAGYRLSASGKIGGQIIGGQAVRMSSSSLSLLGSGYLSTQGSQLVNASGSDVRIASIGWNQNFGDIPGTVAAMAQAGFNTIRISWVDATLQANLATIKQVVAAASADGMKVIIDHHTDEAGTAADGYGAQQRNGLWIDQGPGTDGTNGAGVRGTVDAAKFQADWLTVARTFAGNSTVIGFDLDNEPTSVGHITWGGGGPTDIHAMYQTVGSAIQAVDPGALIIAEGPINYGGSFAGGGTAPEGDLSIAGAQPVTLTIPNKLVYSVHEYPTEISAMPVDSGPAAISRMNQAWGYLVTRSIAPVWVGEMGANMTTANSQAWAATLTGYMNGKDAAQGGPAFTGTQQPVSGDWWAWGYLPGQEPDGTLNANGTLNQAQKAVWSQLLPVAAVSPATACFAAGTRILAQDGAVAVENLIAGDIVILHDGGTAPVAWIGRRHIDVSRHPKPERVAPVLFEANSLGDNIPERDLLVSPDHALFLDGYLIPAKSLINGATIRQISCRRITYYHVELPRHGVLYAEGAPAESYLETGNRAMFENSGPENGGVLTTLHPDFAQALREDFGCAPFAEAGDVVAGVRTRLLARAGLDLTDDPALSILYRKDEAVILSRTAIPGDISADPRDRRRLGVKLAAITIEGWAMPLDHPALLEGWHDPEPDGRWTDGAAVIPAEILQGSRALRLVLAATLAYLPDHSNAGLTRADSRAA